MADSIAVLQNSQVRVVMITGDAEATAAAVARALGIRSEGRRMVSGADLEEMSEERLKGQIDSVYCFYRVVRQNLTLETEVHTYSMWHSWNLTETLVSRNSSKLNDHGRKVHLHSNLVLNLQC